MTPAILCVDDESTILDTLKEQLLRRFGNLYSYELAENAEEAWEVIEELDEDGVPVVVIVSDWLMPGIKGDEFLIQVHQQFPKMIKIMLTGQADPTAIARIQREAVLDAFLQKPWTEEQLSSAIVTALEAHNG
jgi:CheY-like chemotaxis protein